MTKANPATMTMVMTGADADRVDHTAALNIAANVITFLKDKEGPSCPWS